MQIMLKHKRKRENGRESKSARHTSTQHKKNEKLLESCAPWPHREKLALLAAKRKLSRRKARGGNVSEKAWVKCFHRVVCVACSRLLVKYLLQVSCRRRRRRIRWSFRALGKCFKLGIFFPRRRKHDS